MTVFGYWRCSTTHQDGERQVLALKAAGADVILGDNITGVSTFGERPELSKCLEQLKSGDTLLIAELSRLSRTFLGMVNELSKLIERNIAVKTLDRRLDTTSLPKEMTMLIVSILGYSASQELEQIKSRTAEGRAVAKNRGVKFGMKRKYNPHQIAEIMKKRAAGEGYGTIGRSLGISRATIASIVKREEVAL